VLLYLLHGGAIPGIWTTLLMEENKGLCFTNNFLEIRRPSCADRKLVICGYPKVIFKLFSFRNLHKSMRIEMC
jgi:hypothetical protein